MDKFDKKFIEKLTECSKFDSRFVKVFSSKNCVDALVRVHNPLHFGLLEKKFEITHLYPFIRTVGVKCNLNDAMQLERMREVEYVCAQSQVFALDDALSRQGNQVDDDNFGDSVKIAYGNNGLRLNEKLDGDGVTMCVLDTGISPHADLSIPRERIAHFVDMVNHQKYPYDDNGHGTFVTGVAIGNGLTSGRDVVGVAPKSNVVGIKVIGSDGESGAYTILDGMQWLFDNFRQYGIRVACMSFGAEPLPYADPLKIGVEMLVRSGLIVVVASGNNGENSLKSPAISKDVIAVGSVDENGNVAKFTSRGVYQGVVRPDVYAKGVGVIGVQAGGTYMDMSGTSVSAPYIAGACCLLCQRYRNLTPYQAKNIILNASTVKNGVRVFDLENLK